MSFDPRILGYGVWLGGIGCWFVWRLWPREGVKENAHAPEARRLIANGFSWWAVGSIVGFVTFRLLDGSFWVPLVLLLATVACILKGALALFRGGVEGFAATNPEEPSVPMYDGPHTRQSRRQEEREIERRAHAHPHCH